MSTGFSKKNHKIILNRLTYKNISYIKKVYIFYKWDTSYENIRCKRTGRYKKVVFG